MKFLVGWFRHIIAKWRQLVATFAHWLIAIVCVVVMLSVNINHNLAASFASTTMTVNGMALKFISMPLEWMEEVKQYFTDQIILKEIQTLRTENSMLQDELTKLKVRNMELENISAALDFQTPKSTRFIGTRIVRASLDSRNKTVVMQVGYAHGVGLESYVLSVHGLLGKVVEVGQYHSKVKAITAAYHKTPVITSASRQKAILIGNVDGQDYMDIIYCTNIMALQDSEVVVSSGDGGVYPYGIAIGVVKKEGDGAIIMPFFDIKRLEFVKVSQ
jgi:rod shape-determining protein MreC